jgi:hypothetical protein
MFVTWLEMPPDQKASHTRSTLFYNSPVITPFPLSVADTEPTFI